MIRGRARVILTHELTLVTDFAPAARDQGSERLQADRCLDKSHRSIGQEGIEAARMDEPAPKSDGAAAGSNGKSSGLVQGTAFLASTTMNVLDVPSVMSASFVPLPFSNRAPLPDEDLVGRGKRLDGRLDSGTGRSAAFPCKSALLCGLSHGSSSLNF